MSTFNITWDDLPQLVEILDFGDPALSVPVDFGKDQAATIDRFPTRKKEEFVNLQEVFELYGNYYGDLVWMLLEAYQMGQQNIIDYTRKEPLWETD